MDNFMKDLTQLMKMTFLNTKKKKKGRAEANPCLPAPPIIPSFDVNKFYDSVLSAVALTKLLEERLKSTPLASSID